MRNCKVYKRFFDEAPIGLYRTRCSDGLFLDINPCGAKLLGYDSPIDIINKVYSTELYPTEQRAQLLAVLKEKKEITDFEVQVVRRDGKRFWVSLTARNGGEEIIGSIADIDKNKQLESELAEYRNQSLAPIVTVCQQAKRRLAKFDSSGL